MEHVKTTVNQPLALDLQSYSDMKTAIIDAEIRHELLSKNDEQNLVMTGSEELGMLIEKEKRDLCEELGLPKHLVEFTYANSNGGDLIITARERR